MFTNNGLPNPRWSHVQTEAWVTRRSSSIVHQMLQRMDLRIARTDNWELRKQVRELQDELCEAKKEKRLQRRRQFWMRQRSKR